MKKLFTLLFAALMILQACDDGTTKADLIISNAEVFLPSGETQKLDIIIEGDKIKALEKTGEHSWTSENVIDANGNFTIPGLNDAHAHFLGVGRNETQVDLLATSSWQEVVGMVAKKATEMEPGEWIVGRGWHQEKWSDTPSKSVNGFPAHDDLSAVSPDNPVMLGHASGHGLIANQKAMELSGVDKNTISPAGGQIVKDDAGNPIGVFQENAMMLIRSEYQKEQDARSAEEKEKDRLEFIRLAEKVCHENGLTSVQIAGISMEDAIAYRDLAAAGELNVRLYCMLSEDVLRTESEEDLRKLMESGKSLEFFKCRSVKAYMDGALGSRGAWLLEDYSDKPGYAGENVTPLDTLRRSAAIAKTLGMQYCTHAIGDRANREILDIYAEKDVADKRWRIEHAQHLNPDDIPRFAELGVIASMQPIHCTSDAPYVIDRLGEERAEGGAYVWRSILNNNGRLAFGTDAPVERINPFENIYAAVTRQPASMDSPFYPGQKMTRAESINIYTAENAYAEFAEAEKGKIEPGMLADIVVLDRNLLTCAEDDIAGTKVLFTIVGGKVKYINR